MRILRAAVFSLNAGSVVGKKALKESYRARAFTEGDAVFSCNHPCENAACCDQRLWIFAVLACHQSGASPAAATGTAVREAGRRIDRAGLLPFFFLRSSAVTVPPPSRPDVGSRKIR